MSDTAALLLAAGESQRMGAIKALLPWKGVPLLDHQITALLQAGVDTVIVVLGHRAGDLEPVIGSRPGVTAVVNPDYAQGKTTSIKTGLRALRPGPASSILILNVDQPREPQTIQTLLSRHQEARALITIPAYRGKGGHPIVVDSSLLDDLLAIDEESQGVKALVRLHEDRTLRTEMAADVLWDLNTPEEYRQALGP